MLDNENVSIIIATHNNSSTITRALESVTKGIRPANQVIVVDNESSDDTYHVLCNLLGAEKVIIDGETGLPPQFDGEFNGIPVRILRKRISTIGHTLNVAMQSKWQGVTIFGFMDPTSWYAPDKLVQSIRALNSHSSIACIVSDCDNYHLDGKIERVFRCSFDMQRLMTSYPYDSNFLVRSLVFQKLKCGFNEQMQTRVDYEFLLRVSEIGLIYHIPAPLHNNTILDTDMAVQQMISQSEVIAQQLTVKRRGS